MNESMVIIIEGVSDHSADMQRSGKNGEMDVMGYQTENFHICPGATQAFKELVSRGFRGEQAEMLAQLAALIDDYLEIEIRAERQGGVDMETTKHMINLGNGAFFHLGAFAMDVDDESIISMFDFMPQHALRVMELSTEEIIEDYDEDCGCH